MPQVRRPTRPGEGRQYHISVEQFCDISGDEFLYRLHALNISAVDFCSRTGLTTYQFRTHIRCRVAGRISLRYLRLLEMEEAMAQMAKLVDAPLPPGVARRDQIAEVVLGHVRRVAPHIPAVKIEDVPSSGSNIIVQRRSGKWRKALDWIDRVAVVKPISMRWIGVSRGAQGHGKARYQLAHTHSLEPLGTVNQMWAAWLMGQISVF